MRINEVAQVIGWGKTRTHRAIVTGEIPAVMVSQGPSRRCWRVRPSALEKWIDSRDIPKGKPGRHLVSGQEKGPGYRPGPLPHGSNSVTINIPRTDRETKTPRIRRHVGELLTHRMGNGAANLLQ